MNDESSFKGLYWIGDLSYLNLYMNHKESDALS